MLIRDGLPSRRDGIRLQRVPADRFMRLARA